MRFQVKPHSGILSFFLSTRRPSALAIRHPADASLLPSPWHSFSPAALPSPCGWGRAAGEKEARLGDVAIRGPLLAKAFVSAGVVYGPSSAPGQPNDKANLPGLDLLRLASLVSEQSHGVAEHVGQKAGAQESGISTLAPSLMQHKLKNVAWVMLYGMM